MPMFVNSVGSQRPLRPLFSSTVYCSRKEPIAVPRPPALAHSSPKQRFGKLRAGIKNLIAIFAELP